MAEMKNFEYRGKEFGLKNVVVDNTLQRVVINDGGLEFPMENYEKAGAYLVDEYGGTLDEAIAILNATESLEGITVPGSIQPVDNSKMKEKGTGKKTRTSKNKDKDGKAADKENKKGKTDKAKVEKKEMTFKLPGQDVTRTVQVKTILPDQIPVEKEDIKLTDKIGLHIDIYSQKNRTTELYKFKEGVEVKIETGKNGDNQYEVDKITNYDEVKGEVLIAGVSLMDAIYKFAEADGQSFSQADKYIKICRGLLPKVTNKPKEDKVTADSLKNTKKAENKEATTEVDSKVEAE